MSDYEVAADDLMPSLADLLVHNRRPVSEKTDLVTLTVDGRVLTLTVRGLTRTEYLIADKKYGDDEFAKEQFLASCALLDPKLTMEQVALWQKVSGPTEINQVMLKVNELSGVGAGADKS